MVSDSSLAEVLRARGLRLTAQRQLVLEAVYELGHATPEQVHNAVRETAAGVNITTIYRTLELLEELGLVTHTHLSHGSPTYHAAGNHQHVHLVCRSCGEVTEIDPSVLAPLVDHLATERGFRVDVGHVALFGDCHSCEGREQG
jgi:Fur family transcriptional regulator, ferric uptake regulator